MKAFFDRTKPMYIDTEGSFYSTEVEVTKVNVTRIKALRTLMIKMEAEIQAAASPEVSNQRLATYFVEELAKIFKEKDRG